MEKNLKSVLYNHGVSLKKAYGQNFLTDEILLLDIVEKAGVTENDVVLEIGCGAGALTKALSLKAKKVIGYEIDKTLKPVLNETLFGIDNVEIIFEDIMKESVSNVEKKIGGEYKLVANLPYYITTPLVMNFIENSKNLISMSVMVQEEVAYRFSAEPCSPDYGAVTVGINLRGNAKVVKKVPREMFTPIPNVDSAVVRIDIDKDKFNGVDFKAVRDAVKIGFGARRKMLVNNIINCKKISREKAEEVLSGCGISLTARGETLSVYDYIKLSEKLKEYE